MNKIITAFQFLTILPLKVKNFQEELLPESTIYFPLVGLTLGVGLVGLDFFLSPVLPLDVVAVIQIAFLALATRGLHLDGFADTFDGLGCVKSKEEKLLVMKDSHIGVMGAVAIIFLLLLKYNSITLIEQSVKTYALFIFPMVSRWAMVLTIFYSNQVGHTGLGNKFQEQIKEKHLILSSILPCLIVVFFFGIPGLMVLIGICVFTFIMYRLLLRSFGKITGDHFGFINEVIEVVVLVVFLLI